MSNIKYVGKLLRTSSLSKIHCKDRFIGFQNIQAGTEKIGKAELLVDSKNEDLIDKGKNEKYLLKGETISMRDPPNRWSLYTEYRDDSELVKHIEVLQRFADRYNDALKDVGPVETIDKTKPKSDNKVKDIQIWNKTSKKHFSTASSNFNEPKSKKERVFITLENEPPIDKPLLPKSTFKKPILLYSIGSENDKNVKKLPEKPKSFVPLSTKSIKQAIVKAGVENDKINNESSDDEKISTFKNEALSATLYSSKDNKINKAKALPDYYKQAHSVLIRSFTTNKEKKFVISDKRSGAIDNCNGIPVRTLMKEAETKELPKVNHIKFNGIYKGKERKKTLKECLIANKDIEEKPKAVKNPPVERSDFDTMKILNDLNIKKKIHNNKENFNKNLTESLVADRKAKGNQCENELKPKIFCKTSLLVKPSHLPITKCKRMVESDGYRASSVPQVNRIEKSLQKVGPSETQLELHESSKQKDKSIIKRLITFFKK